MTHLGLFEGIGGFSLAARWAGWQTLAWCEWNEFGQKVLKYHFPEAEGFSDITKSDFKKYNGKIDIITGGFPCQPYSLAGKRKGKDDERHLWPEMLRVIREVQPTYVVGENVFGLINWNGGMVFDEVQSDLEAEGYEVWAYVLPAAAVNAPHRRDRVWFVAYTAGNGYDAKPTTTDNKIRQNNQQSRTQRQRTAKRFSNEWNATNTDSNGCDKCNGNNEKHTGQGGINALDDTNSVTMHTNGTSEQREHIRQQRQRKSYRPNSGDGINDFQNFPTQSPICNGDDGLSSRLDSITFPKWRNESIKAGGNAIVPQVAYQIFKAINLYNQTNN